MIKSSNKYSKFWIVDELNSEFTTLLQDKIDTTTKGILKLSALRRSISRFVKIICGKMVPVEFLTKDRSYTDGKRIYISARVERGGLDSVVGLAMHEASHIKETDFKILSKLKYAISGEIYKKAASKNMKRKSTVKIIKNLFNWVEDRRIDHKTYMRSPGYKGYYIAMYNRYFNSDIISKILQSNYFRDETIQSYKFRIINLTNKYTDLTALKGLQEISDIINLKDIDRLHNSSDSLLVTFRIFDIILDNIKMLNLNDNKQIQRMKSVDDEDSDDSDDSGDNDDMDDEDGDGDGDEDGEDGDGEDGDGSGKNRKIKYDPNANGKGKNIILTDKELEDLQRQIEKQEDFLNGEVKKYYLSGEDLQNINELQDSKTEIRTVSIKDNKSKQRIYESIYDGKTYDVVVMRDVSEQMFDSHSVPFSSNTVDCDTSKAIVEGIAMGKKLGKRLLVRNDEKIIKYTRKESGKIDRRLLSELGFNNESVFKRSYIESYSNAILHMSIDISGSMGGDKLDNALRLATAICKAAEMLNKNLNVIVSLRGTTNSGEPLVAIVYDSRVDKFIKIKHLFPRITSSGATPEGLCFAAIQHLIDESDVNLNSYFLNLSDGEPYYNNYSGELAALHTRGEIHKMREKGIKILSYFIHSGNEFHHNDFKTMYGESAAFINVNNLNDIIKTLNKLFLEKSNNT